MTSNHLQNIRTSCAGQPLLPEAGNHQPDAHPETDADSGCQPESPDQAPVEAAAGGDGLRAEIIHKPRTEELSILRPQPRTVPRFSQRLTCARFASAGCGEGLQSVTHHPYLKVLRANCWPPLWGPLISENNIPWQLHRSQKVLLWVIFSRFGTAEADAQTSSSNNLESLV